MPNLRGDEVNEKIKMNFICQDMKYNSKLVPKKPMA